uniref:Uncharacterized protein n=1 Tax=Arundo donax TaxID=35708 RepID=A0A0A9H1Z5_ARUDO
MSFIKFLWYYLFIIITCNSSFVFFNFFQCL